MQKALLFAIRLYRGAFTPLRVALGLYGCCRFTPTCSQYAEEALCTHGLWRGLSLTLWRLLRCHPWGGYGPDPVPPRCCDPHKTSLFC